MVKGIDRFRDYFRGFTDQYVLIGGAACDISYENNNVDFRATRDLDIVLIVEALTREFGQRFWEIIRDGGYQNRAKSSGAPQFYRFDKPTQKGFPLMIKQFTNPDGASYMRIKAPEKKNSGKVGKPPKKDKITDSKPDQSKPKSKGGRPKGSSDTKPRKPRSDKGKKRVKRTNN